MSKKQRPSSKTDVSAGNNGFMMQDSDRSQLVPHVEAKNEEQKNALKAIHNNMVTIITGPAGCGKTHIATGYGLQEKLLKKRFNRIILTRPIVESGESLGYLPGNFQAKVAPYMMPIYDILNKYVSKAEIDRMVKDQEIMIIPLAYMRGITMENSYVICDEMQNATPQQFRLLLTRIGEGSKIVMTGDVTQSDLIFRKHNNENGLKHAMNLLTDVEDLSVVHMTHASCVRPRIVADIDKKYRAFYGDDSPDETSQNVSNETENDLIKNAELSSRYSIGAMVYDD